MISSFRVLFKAAAWPIEEVMSRGPARGDRGAALVEYALLTSLMAIAALGGLRALKGVSSDHFDRVATEIGTGHPVDRFPTSTTAPDAGADSDKKDKEDKKDKKDKDEAGTTTTIPPTTVATATTQPATTVPTTVATTTTRPTITTAAPTTTMLTTTTRPTATTAAPTTTMLTTTTRPTTTTLPAQVAALSASASGRGQWWDSSGQQGAWVAATSFTYQRDRQAFLTVEVTSTLANGQTVTSTRSDVYVPANGSSTVEIYDNAYDNNPGTTTDVVSVSFKVTSVRTYTSDWRTETFTVDGPQVTATAPAAP